MGAITALRPDAVIHCAAWTAVDAAEDDASREKVFALHAKGPENIARVCRAVKAKLIYLSTDYVFDGRGTAPWKPDCTRFAPLNVYGQSKLAGEAAIAFSINIPQYGEISLFCA